MAKMDLGIKAIILGVSIGMVHWFAHSIGQPIMIVGVLVAITSTLAIFTSDMW